MATRANVTSIEALEAFRASLILYIGKARPTLEEIQNQVLRTRMWLENDQRVHWENQVRKRAKALEDAQQELFSANIANLRQATAAEQMAVRKAKRSLEEAEDKLQAIKRWRREFESQVAPLLKQLEKLHTQLSHDMPEAAVFLAQVVKTLDAYAGIAPSADAQPSPEQPPNTADAGASSASAELTDNSADLTGGKP